MVFIGQSDDTVSVKQWGIYNLLAYHYYDTAEPINTQLLSVSVDWAHITMRDDGKEKYKNSTKSS